MTPRTAQLTTVLAHHAAVEALALFIPALAIVGVIAGAVLLDRRRAAEEEEEDGRADGERDGSAVRTPAGEGDPAQADDPAGEREGRGDLP